MTELQIRPVVQTQGLLAAIAANLSLESILTTIPKIQHLEKNSAKNSAFSEIPVQIQSFGHS